MSTDHLTERLGYEFKDPTLLAAALTHPSARTATSPQDYQRLEFLGDRVVALVVAELLYRNFPTESEGLLARRHVALVRREAIAKVAEALELGAALTLARGEDEAGGRRNPTLLADAGEAVIGAIFADGGFAAAEPVVRRLWEPMLSIDAPAPRDAKTALQEWAQGRGKPLPAYSLEAMEGPPHEPTFRIAVAVKGEEPATGKGRSKREAEQAAAAALLTRLTP